MDGYAVGAQDRSDRGAHPIAHPVLGSSRIVGQAIPRSPCPDDAFPDRHRQHRQCELVCAAVVVSAARTPIGRAFRGAFNQTPGATMAGHVVAEALKRAGDAGHQDDGRDQDRRYDTA